MKLLFWPFDPSGFPARWHCGGGWAQEPWLGWMHIVSDIAIWIAYMSIPIALAYFILKKRDVPFPRILWLFCAFIAACGTVHLIEAVIFWRPVYRLAGLVKMFTAGVSLATVVALIRIAPTALKLPGLAQMSERLLIENAERRKAESQYLELNRTLEAAVAERTADLKREIAERERAHAALREREARIEAIISSAAEGIMTIDMQGLVESVNPAACRIFGYEAEEFVGRSVSSLIGTSEDGAIAGIDALRAKSTREFEARKKDGGVFPIQLTASEFDTASQPLLTCIFRDLTEWKKLHLELAQAQKLESVGQLAAGIAHEINTPVQYVHDNTRFLKEAFGDISAMLDRVEKCLQLAKDGRDDQQLIADIETALRQADIDYLTKEIPQAVDQSLDGVERVAKIVRAMKEFAHPGIEEKSLVDLKQAVETTITVAANEWKYAAEMETEFDSQLPPVLCLPGEVNQVLLNLIVNAAHAIGEVSGGKNAKKGKITVGTRRDGEWAEIFVRDTGGGIPEEVRARIFDPFFTTKDVGKGTGQGLAIARSVVVDKHGGAIRFETELGVGTTFVVRLPIGGEVHRQRTAADSNDVLPTHS